MRLILIAVTLLIVACGNVGFNTKKRVLACSVEDTTEGALVTCADGSTTIVNDGTDGTDGQNGADAAVPFIIVDPCGDGQGADEVVLVFTDGSVLAWYVNLGLSVLSEGINYQTTDQQACRFKIVSGQVVEL